MANSDDAKKIGGDLKNSGVSVEHNGPNVYMSGTPYGLGLGIDVPIATKAFTLGASVHSGSPAIGNQFMGRADFKPLNTEFGADSPVGKFKADAGVFGAIAYGERGSHSFFGARTNGDKGFVPIAGLSASVEHVKSGFNMGFDAGLPLTSSNSHNSRYSSNYEPPFVGVKFGKRF